MQIVTAAGSSFSSVYDTLHKYLNYCRPGGRQSDVLIKSGSENCMCSKMLFMSSPLAIQMCELGFSRTAFIPFKAA